MNLPLRLVSVPVVASAPTLPPQSTTRPLPRKDEETVKMQAFTVTGTNIRRIDEEKTRGLLGNTSVRAGVSNVFRTEPPFLGETRAGGVVAACGRADTVQLSKRL